MSDSSYTISGSAPEYIRANPEMYLPAGSIPVAYKLVQVMLTDCLALGCSDVHVIKENDWWAIFSKKDWLVSGDASKQISDLFNSIYAMPEAGPNSIRHEVVVNAFSEDVLTSFNREVTFIRQTDEKQLEQGKRLCLSAEPYSRVVAFRCAK